MSNKEDRLDWLEAHRELEYLRQAGRVMKRRVPPKFQQNKIKNRAHKLTETQKAKQRRDKRNEK